MPIDYTKRPSAPAAPAAATTPSKVTLTKSAPRVSLTKRADGGGVLRVNLNWNSRPQGAGGFFAKREPDLDLDLGCLYEFADGTKGVVQALGNGFAATARGAAGPTIWLDGDDRSGSNSAGENLFVDLAQTSAIRRVLIFALIYQGSRNWAGAQGVVTLHPAAGPQIEVHLDEPRDGARSCAIALLTPAGGELAVQREVRYIDGAQDKLDEAYGWGISWAAGRK